MSAGSGDAGRSFDWSQDVSRDGGDARTTTAEPIAVGSEQQEQK
jgi:hypothetical protein